MSSYIHLALSSPACFTQFGGQKAPHLSKCFLECFLLKTKTHEWSKRQLPNLIFSVIIIVVVVAVFPPLLHVTFSYSWKVSRPVIAISSSGGGSTVMVESSVRSASHYCTMMEEMYETNRTVKRRHLPPTPHPLMSRELACWPAPETEFTWLMCPRPNVPDSVSGKWAVMKPWLSDLILK